MEYFETLLKSFELFLSYESQPDSIKSIVNPVLSVILVLFALGTIISKLQLDKIIEHIDKRQARKINTLNDVATSSLNSTDLKDFAQDILEANYFKAATNIYAEKHKRSLLIDLYRKTDQKFTWEDIKLSLEYAKFDSDEIYYQELKWHHRLGYKFNKFMGVFSAFFLGLYLYKPDIFL